MKLKRLWKPLAIFFAIVVLFILVFNNPFRSSDYARWNEEITDEMYAEALAVIQGTDEYITRYPYISFLESREVVFGLPTVSAILTTPRADNEFAYTGTKAADLETESSAFYQVNVATAGLYHVSVDYFVKANVLNNLTVSVKINGAIQYDDAKTVDIPLVWEDDSKDFVLDTYGDESLPNQIRVLEWRNLRLYNNTYVSVDPLLFYFEQGMNTIEIENIIEGALLLGDLTLESPIERINYATYIGQYAGQAAATSTITFDAVDYVEKNSSFVRLYAFQSPSVAPFDAIDKKLNVVNGGAWYRSGHEVIYEFTVDTAGKYQLALHYLNDKSEYSVFRSISVDGEIPFAEFASYEFKTTGTNTWKNETLGNADGSFELYLTAGTHRLSFRAETAPIDTALRDIQLLVDHINGFAINILKITGATIDEDRKWEFTKYIPETAIYLQSYDTIMKYQIVQLSQYSEKSDLSATLAFLKTAVSSLQDILEEPDKVPLYLAALYSGVGSITQMLGDSLTALARQPLYLDSISLYGGEADLGKANANFILKLGSNIRSFTSSFTEKKYVTEDDPEAVNIWVNRSLIYVDLMQKMADQAFGNSDLKFKISIMPDASKLILANAAGATPDIALGLASYMPFDLAIRGALQDLSIFEDFWSVADSFAPGAFVPYILEDGIYGIPETLEFHALVYRKDTLDALDIDVPNTWDDVIDMLPKLQRYKMNFFYPTSGGSSLKWFYQTSALIYQYDGSLYSPDGLSASISSENSYKGLKLLSDLYTTYSLPSFVASFYNSFRYNTLPIGIIDFGTYLTLKNAAPELTGGWELALYPGVRDEDGNINRSYIANGNAAVMFKNTDEVKLQTSWDFLKWWMSTPTQTEFAFLLQSTYGPEYVWLSGNIDAVANSPIDAKDKAIILEQVTWLVDVPRTPGQYMLERGLSEIWNTVTFDGTPIRVAIDDQVLKINREITKKMIEFGYIDSDGNILVPYTIRDKAWIEAQILAYKQANGGE